MSWLTELAGKAENILNKLDTEVASVLPSQRNLGANAQLLLGQTPATISTKDITSGIYDHRRSSFQSSSSVPENLFSIGDGGNEEEITRHSESLTSSPKRSRDKGSIKMQQNPNFSLRSFLNENQTDSKTLVGIVPALSNVPIDRSDVSHSRQSSLSDSGSSFLAISGRNTPGFTSLDIESSNGSCYTDPYMKLERPSQSLVTSQSSNDSENGNNRNKGNRMSSRKQEASENQESAMLRREVTSLNQEMSHVLRRAKESEKETKRFKEQISALSVQQRQTEALLREMHGRETHLQEIVKSKEKLLEASQAKFQESLSRIKEREKTIKELQEQNKRLLEGASLSTSLQSEMVTSLQEKLKDTQDALERQTTLYSHSTDEFNAKMSQFEEDQKALMRDISESNKNLQEERSKTASLTTQLSVLKKDLSASIDELTDYKAKAGRILASKDSLIASLKEGREGPPELVGEEMEQLKGERDLLKEELAKALGRTKLLTNEMAEMELIAHQEAKNTLHQMTQFQEDILREQSEKSVVQDELCQAQQELKCLQAELTRQKVNLSSRLQDRDAEIQRLQKQIAHKQSSSTSVSELESKIHGLAESLIVKQTIIESLSADKHSLQIQLERLEKQYQESQSLLNKDLTIELNQEEVRNRGIPAFLLESPFDDGVSRRVKRAYGNLDKFSVRLGIFLRRYPLARVFVLLYMGLLHVWVSVVLLTYKPEIHDSDFVHPYQLLNTKRSTSPQILIPPQPTALQSN